MGALKTNSTNSASLVKGRDLEIRKYQTEIANKCILKNSLVVLPTGLGKTIIAVLVASRILQTYPPQSKIIVLAPTRPLINQHYDTFMKFLTLPEDTFVVLTGKVNPQDRAEIFNNSQIIFYTPQTLRNDLIHNKYTLETTALIIFDEAHHASGDYPYTMIAEKFVEQNPDGTILGLTASPGASKQKINMLCKNLFISQENIHIRTRKDRDVKTYLKPMDVYKIGVNLTELMSHAYELLNSVLEERLQYLSQLNFLEIKGEPLYAHIIRKDLLRLNSELIAALKNGDTIGVYSALSINAQGLILFHMQELIEQQGLDVLLHYLEKMYKDAKKKNSSKAVRVLTGDYRLNQLFLELKKNHDFTPDNLIHPKYQVLVKVILDELRTNPISRILVFVKLRDSVKNIVNKLKDTNGIHAVRFVGQATKSTDDKGLSQKQQIEILDQFREGEYNVLVSTNVGEEGLDIAECDLVIFYDVVASEIRLIQRKGRTARHRQGRVIILYCKNTHDEIYLRIALNKLKRMNFTLRQPTQEREHYEFPLVDIESVSEMKSTELVPREIRRENTRQRQSNLRAFLHPKEEGIKDAEVKISSHLSMKYGLRKQLEQNYLHYEITDSDLHIILLNKVLIQIYPPDKIADPTFISELNDFQELCELLIIVFDFITFKEELEGEKRVLRERLIRFGKDNQLHVICIDNEEELSFIVKNILDTQKEEI